MKVGLVCPYDLGRFGGVQHQVITLAGWLRDAGHSAQIVGPGETGPPGAALLGPTTVIPANGAATPIRLDLRAGARVAEAVADCDVVHVHEPFMPMVSLGALVRVRRPIVATFHAAPPRWVERTYRLGKRAVAAMLGRAAVVTAVSPVAARALPVATSRLIPNGIDTSLFPPHAPVPARVGFVGRDDPRKGLGILLAAWPRVLVDVPGATLHVVGTEHGGDTVPGVTFHGRLDEDGKRDVLSRCAVFCAPNTGGESFGITVVEAMAAGCAVVASAIPGFVFAAGNAARWVSPGDADALAEALAGVLGKDDEQIRLQRAASDRVSRFDRDVILGAYLDAYEDAIASS